MPRALARNRVFSRVGTLVGLADPCMGSFSNSVSNSPPSDPDVFAAAARGLVQRVVEGSGDEPGREAKYWEVWNEFELGYAWTGTGDDYFGMALRVLLQLDAYRAASTASQVKGLHFGMGSFASAQVAASVIDSLDATPLSTGAFAPLDFLSFHAYDNDPLVILAQVQQVFAARERSRNYRNLELVLSEWGPNLNGSLPSASMDTSLLVASVLARAPVLGVTRTHRSLFFDFVPGVELAYTPLHSDGTPKPLYRAYELLHALVDTGGARLPVTGASDGAFANGLGAVLVLKPAVGGVRAIIVNRDSSPHHSRLDLAGRATLPSRVRVFDDPSQAPRDVAPTVELLRPARSLVLVEQ